MKELKLISIRASEYSDNKPILDIKKSKFSDFNLLIGDNAQGKTRLFKIFNFLQKIISEKPFIISSHFIAELEFLSSDEDVIKYSIEVLPREQKNVYFERIENNGKLIFSTKDKLLFNEKNQSSIDNFFIPNNIPALNSIDSEDFSTINLLKEFFTRIVYISATKFREIAVTPELDIPNPEGTNIASVLENWSNNYPDRYSEVENEFKIAFSFINKLFFSQQSFGSGITHNLLTVNEKGVNKALNQTKWSDGVYRTLHLLMSPLIPFTVKGKIECPSLILIDEIENGLDFKTLRYIINYLKDYSDDTQIAFSSHSPLVCEFVHPNYWIIVKRQGVEINFISPQEVEKGIDKQLDTFKHKYWDFYSKHISNSNLYIVE